MKTSGLGLFIRRGMLTAVAIAALCAGLAWVGWTRSNLLAGVFYCVLVGPMPLLLTLFDITNRQLEAFALLATLPYWVGIGVIAGWFRWSCRIAPPALAPISSRPRVDDMSGLVCILALSGAVVSFTTFTTANRLSNEGSAVIRILSNLQQIDGAKQTLASERSLPRDYVPTEAELAPYLDRRGPFPRSRPWGERYVINAIGTAPYAILDSDYRVRRRGWTEGSTVPKGKVVRLE